MKDGVSQRTQKTPLDAYQKKLFAFLGVATFFEGYDFIALSQILPTIRGEMHLSESEGGLLIGVVNIGTVLAYLLVRAADRWGRRRLLTITIAGYTVFTFFTGLMPNVWAFGACQLVARTFLIAEWATSNVIAAEEFPAERRGMVIGVIQGCSSLGSIVCAGVVPLLLRPQLIGVAVRKAHEVGVDLARTTATPPAWGWRTVYFVGIVPLIVMAFARRSLRETKRFASADTRTARSLFHLWRTPYRRRMLQLGLIWSVTYLCTASAVAFWKEFVMAERQMKEGDAGLAISVAAVASMPLVFYSGKLLDQIGRRAGAAVIFGLGALGVFLCYTLEGQWPLTFALVFGMFGASAVLPVLNAWNTELFPTELRGDAFAWANNILGRIGYVASPLIVGALAESTGSWGGTMRYFAIAPLVALVLIFLMLPETNKKELEETAKL